MDWQNFEPKPYFQVTVLDYEGIFSSLVLGLRQPLMPVPMLAQPVLPNLWTEVAWPHVLGNWLHQETWKLNNLTFQNGCFSIFLGELNGSWVTPLKNCLDAAISLG